MTDAPDPFDALLKDLGPDPDHELTEEELNEIAGTPTEDAVIVGETPEPEPEPEAVEAVEAEKPKRGRPRKVATTVVEDAPVEPAQPVLTGVIVGSLSPQTLAEMEAGRRAISRGRIE
jgi:hypothetical protein